MWGIVLISVAILFLTGFVFWLYKAFKNANELKEDDLYRYLSENKKTLEV